MQTLSLTEWRNSPETQALLAFLQHRQSPVLSMFLAGNPVPPELQGRVAGLHELETLLTGPVDKVNEVFTKALREHITK